jgi:CRISPR-associated protein Csb3
MSEPQEAAIRIPVDPSNPGQFFACCGLLELADRLWGGAEGWFDGIPECFCLAPSKPRPASPLPDPIEALSRCPISNSMTRAQISRRHDLAAIAKGQREEAGLEDEKKDLDALWRTAPLRLANPFDLVLDWFLDERAGGDAFKTWAGQQSVMDIALAMKAPIDAADWRSGLSPEQWFAKSSAGDDVPFYFDAALGGIGSDLDVGFAFDPLKSLRLPELQIRTRPLVEFMAFVGLQRFRPSRVAGKSRYSYFLWFEPLPPQIASAYACGAVAAPNATAFEFRLLYRTDYLKAFLPAKPV